jgi:hypothetical protein
MWNFVGRQSDNQGRYGTQEGNWLSGVTFIDELHLGSQENLPNDVLNNKGRNVFLFTIPLGLIGLMYHATKNMKVLCSTSLIPIYWFCIKNLSKRETF